MFGVQDTQPGELPDFFLQNIPVTIMAISAYFVAKNRHACKGPIKLHDGDTWEALADRLDARFGKHIWHPDHWRDNASVER